MCQVWRFYFQPFWFYCAERQTDRQTEQQNHIQTTQADDRYTHATAVGVSKNAAVADELGRTARILASF